MKRKEQEPFNPVLRSSLARQVVLLKEKNLPYPKKNKVAYTSHKEPFLEAMANVTPLPEKQKKTDRPKEIRLRPPHPAPDDERETLAHLENLVKGTIELDITFTDEYMEGSIRGFNPRIMKQLKRGEIPVQDYLDLHGLTKQEAEGLVRDFLLENKRNGLRCVLIVHGRGLNSPNSFPVLKEGLPIWLGRGPVRKIVLAFATARPYDGGAGAVYVLLRRR